MTTRRQFLSRTGTSLIGLRIATALGIARAQGAVPGRSGTLGNSTLNAGPGAGIVNYLGMNAFAETHYGSQGNSWLNMLKNCSSNYSATGSAWLTSNPSTQDTGEELYLTPILDSDGYPITLLLPGIPGGQQFTFLQTWCNRPPIVTSPLPPGAPYMSPEMMVRFRFQGKCTLNLPGMTGLSSPTPGVEIPMGTTQIKSSNPWGTTNVVTFTIPQDTIFALEIKVLPDPANYFKAADMVETQYAALYDAGNIVHPRYKNFLTDYGNGGYSRIRFYAALNTNQEIRLGFSAALSSGNNTGAALSDVWYDEEHVSTGLWPFPTGTYNVLFATGQLIACNFTYNSATVSWSIALSGDIANAGDDAMPPFAMAIVNRKKNGWNGRPLLSNFSWAAGVGLPLEACIQACNECGTDIWLNIPAGDLLMDSTYATNCAKLCHDGTGAILSGSNLSAFTGLNAAHRADVEISNEIWNSKSPYRQSAALMEMLGVLNGFYAAQSNRQLYGAAEQYGVVCAGVGDAFAAVYGAGMGTRARVGMMNQVGGLALMETSMNTPNWTSAAYTHNIGMKGCAPYAGPSSASAGRNFTSAEIAVIVGCTDPVTELFSLAYTNVGSVTGNTYGIAANGWVGNVLAEVQTMITSWEAQPWASLPFECYEGGTSTKNVLGTSDPSYAAWKTTLTSVLRDSRMAYIYFDPTSQLSGNPGYCQALLNTGAHFNQLGSLQPAVEAADWAGYGTLELISQMDSIPPLTTVPKYQGQIDFIQAIGVIPPFGIVAQAEISSGSGVSSLNTSALDVANGDRLFIVAFGADVKVPTWALGDSGVGNVFTSLTSRTDGGFAIQAWEVMNAKANAVTSITLTETGGTHTYGLAVLQVRGLEPTQSSAVSSAYIQSPGGGTDAISSGTATPAATPAAVIGFSHVMAKSRLAPTAGTGFTGEVPVWGTYGGGDAGGVFEYLTTSAETPIAATFTANSGAQFAEYHSLVFVVPQG